MKSLIKKLNDYIIKSYLHAHFSVRSAYETYKTKHKLNIIIENEFSGGLVVVMALYEKGALRPDIVRYLTSLKSRGAFIVAANTSSLSSESIKENSSLFDVYIERDNLGRDFGSYKDCFQYIFKKEINKNCNRLIMCNDSVYYSQDGMDIFLDEMISNDKSVLGATENHDFHRHLGSFYISMSSDVVSDNRFECYWNKYKKTNVRPKIIKKGELGLSALLINLSKNEYDFASLYNIARIQKSINSVEDVVSYLKMIRYGEYYNGNSNILNEIIKSNPVVRSSLENFVKNNLSTLFDSYYYEVKYQYFISKDASWGFIDLMDFLESINHDTLFISEIKTSLQSILFNVMTQGSQIHFNAIAFKKLGLPIIKMDLLYRHTYATYDLLRLTNYFNDRNEAENYKSLMLTRMTGRNYIFGFKRKAFIEGYI